MSDQKHYRMMEFHRGELIPVKTTLPNGKKGGDRIVKISPESAKEMNRDFSEKRNVGTKIKYVLIDEKEKDEELTKLQEKYKEVVGKKAYHAWSKEELQERIKNHKS